METNIMAVSSVETGYLELIIGPMFSGKTSELLKIYKQCEYCDIQVAIINHISDKRYHETMISSHDKIMAPCYQTSCLRDIWSVNNCNINAFEFIRSSRVILINEGQFFPDLYEVVIDMLRQNKKVYVFGLDGDFQRKKFGEILDLLPMCDKVVKLTSLCSLCKNGKAGIFSMRLTSETEQTIIGSDNYIPVCRRCYDEKTSK
jgi:thymidine kinase